MLIQINCKKEEPTEPKESSKGEYLQKIAFTRYDSLYSPKIAVGDLYDDSGTIRLYNIKMLSNGQIPYLSKNGEWLTYISYEENLALKRINIDGSDNIEIKITTPGIQVQQTAISPDDSNIAINGGGFFTGQELGIISKTGGAFHAITNQTWSGLAWSLDSKRIFFSWMDVNNRFGHNVPPLAKVYIATINVDGTGLKFISDTSTDASDDMEPNLSPDGKEIAFTSFRNHTDEILPEIFSMDINGNNVQRITVALSSPKKGNHYDYYTADNNPRWLNDGKHIMFQRVTYKWDDSINQYTQSEDLYIVNYDGTGMYNLTNNGVSTLNKK